MKKVLLRDMTNIIMEPPGSGIDWIALKCCSVDVYEKLTLPKLYPTNHILSWFYQRLVLLKSIDNKTLQLI